MDIHLSEEEQVEALKKWWKENGRSVIVGIVLGLGGVFGWQYWTQHQRETAEQSSLQFEQLTQSAATGSPAAVAQAQALISSRQDSVYAVFAALELAKIKFKQGDVIGAKAQLQWVVANAEDQSLQQVARLRLARLLLDEGELEGVATLISQAPLDGFKGDFAELRGDVALKKGDKSAARQAYKEAIENKVSSIELVRMKFNDVAAAGSL